MNVFVLRLEMKFNFLFAAAKDWSFFLHTNSVKMDPKSATVIKLQGSISLFQTMFY